MFKDRIPRDIKRYRQNKITVSVIKCAIIYIVEAAVAFLSFGTLNDRFNTASKILFTVIMLLIPLFASGFIKNISDRSWEGRIIAIHKKTTFGNTSILSRGGAYKMYIIEATMHMENGKTDVKTVYEGPAEESQLWLYKEGTVIRHVAGCKYLQVINNDCADASTVCVVCGREEEKPDISICKKCSHTLIK